MHSLGKSENPEEESRVLRGDSGPEMKVDPLSSTDSYGTNTQEDVLDEAIDEKRLLRRVDLTLIPWLSFLYLLCFLDRSAIENAVVRNVLAFLMLRY